MEKQIFRFLLLSMFSLIFMQCKKADDEVIVYKPPVESISFSDVTDLLIDSTGKSIVLKAKITAADGFEKIEIIYAPWNLSKSITSFTQNVYSLNEAVVIPANAALQIHSITVKVTDKKGAVNFVDIKVGLQNLNYNQLYMADVENVAGIQNSLFGVPMVMDKTGSHTYELIYYARAANVKVRFLPNKLSFTPVAVGLDPANSNKLITDGAKSLPITLPNKGYYKISVNTLLLSYNVEGFTPTGNSFNQVAIAGRGFTEYPDMNYQNALPNIILMDKDATNPFLFTKLVKMGIPVGQNYNTTQFIFTTNNGWSNFWRFDNSSKPERAVFNGGTDAVIPTTSTPVSYLLVFDSYTQRVQAIKQ